MTDPEQERAARLFPVSCGTTVAEHEAFRMIARKLGTDMSGMGRRVLVEWMESRFPEDLKFHRSLEKQRERVGG